MQTLLNKGVKYMLVQGHPATGCLTLTMSLAAEDDRDNLGCVKSVNNQSYTHNLALQFKLKQLRSVLYKCLKKKNVLNRLFHYFTICCLVCWFVWLTELPNHEQNCFQFVRQVLLTPTPMEPLETYFKICMFLIIGFKDYLMSLVER